jgi:hypothetical protein
VWAGMKDFSPALPQIGFAAAQQLGADSPTLTLGANADRADDPHSRLVWVNRLSHGGMGKTDAVTVLLGQKKAGRVENGLGEYKTFEWRAVSQSDGPAPRKRSIPDFHKERWVSVAKRAILHHIAPLFLPLPALHAAGAPANPQHQPEA